MRDPRSGHLPGLLTAILIVLAASFAGTQGARAAGPDIAWGVNGHPFNAYPGVPLEQQVKLAADAGLRSYRVNVTSAVLADRLGSLIQLARKSGVTILPVLTPALDLEKLSATQLYREAYDMAYALVMRFKKDVRVWELGNEMENFAIIRGCEVRDNGVKYECAWGPAAGDTPLDYYGPRWAKVSAVLKGLSEGAISADPTVRKAMGTAGWGHIGAFERMKQDGIQWDISVWHMYEQDPNWGLATVTTYGRPIWITEFNQAFGSQKSEEIQATGLRRWMERIRELAPRYRIEAAHIYELMDETYWAPSYEAYMGLVRLEGDGGGSWRVGGLKPAYYAVQELALGRSAPPPAAATSAALPPRNCALQGSPGGDVEQGIAYAYCLVLARDVDGVGLRDWSKTLAGKIDGLPSLVVGLLNSDEFRQAHPDMFRSHDAYVAGVYQLLFDRAPDEAADHYRQGLKLGSHTYATVTRFLVTLPEFRRKHPALFAPQAAPVQDGAAPAPEDTAVLPGWRKCDLSAVASGEMTPARQVDYAYCLVLGRNADGAGLKSYAEKLQAGFEPARVAVGLAASDEFRLKVAQASRGNAAAARLLHVLLLGREPSEDDVRLASERLDRNEISLADLARELISAPEFRQRRPMLFAGG